MHKSWRLFQAGYLFVAAGSAIAQSSAPIKAVTLYPGSATIVRSARIEAGATQLVVADLRTGFAIQTLRVESDAGIRVGQVIIQDAARTESPNAAEAALEARIQALQDEADALDAQAGAADIVKVYLDRFVAEPAAQAEHGRNTIADAKALTALVGALGQAAGEALGRKQQVAVQKREIEKKMAAMQRDLSGLRSGPKDRRTVTIQLIAERAGNLRLSYQVNGAGWKPSYRAELKSSNSSVSLERLAQVSQKTGEDWKDVRLSLSTSQPRLSSTPVSPQPWLLSYYAPRPAQASGAAMMAAAPAPPSAPMASKRADMEEQDEPYQAPTFQSDGNFATEFVVPTPVSIPADGREVSLALARQSLSVKQRLQVTPRIDSTVMLTAEAARPNGVWLAGKLQIYRDANYIGEANWNPQASDKFRFSFGRDDLVQARLEPVQSNAGSTGVFEKRNLRKLNDVITVKSAHTESVDLLVLDAAPVSTADEIKVQSSFTPKPTTDAWEQRRGVVAWEKTLAPQETARFEIGHSIEYPKEGAVNGLR